MSVNSKILSWAMNFLKKNGVVLDPSRNTVEMKYGGARLEFKLGSYGEVIGKR